MSTALIKETRSSDVEFFLSDAEEDRRLLTISEMADRFQTTLRTLRFYEARGLIHPIRKGMTRWYDVQTQRRFELIDEGRKLGFTLTEIGDLLGNSTTASSLKLTVQKIRDQIAHLERQRDEVERALVALRQRYYVMTDPELEEI